MTTLTSQRQDLYGRVAREFARRATERFGAAIHAVVLYGSVARHSAGADSDIDLLVLVEREDGLRDVMHDVSYALDEENDYATSLSPLVMNVERLERLRQGAYPIASEIIRQGEVIYDDGTFIRWRELGPVTPGPESEYVSAQLKEADQMLADAELLQENGRLSSAADRAYYAMWHAAEAALGFRGVEPAGNHRGIVSQLGEDLIQTGALEKSVSEYLTRGHYQLTVSELTNWVERADAERLVANAQEFVGRVSRLIGAPA